MKGDRCRPLRRLLSTPVAAGTNVVITSYDNPFHVVVGPRYFAEGEAAIIRPPGERGFSVVARIRKDEWATLGAR